MSKPIIFCIIGKSGCGKTMVTEFVSQCLGVNVVRSYTTRPMREGETDGKEHIFVREDEMPEKDAMIAYTFFGGHHYWATKKQVEERCLYVIDEDGLRMLVKEYGEDYIILPIYIVRNDADVDSERKTRDIKRKPLDDKAYVNIIDNRDKRDFLFDMVNFIGLCLNHVPTFERWYKNHKEYML